MVQNGIIDAAMWEGRKDLTHLHFLEFSDSPLFGLSDRKESSEPPSFDAETTGMVIAKRGMIVIERESWPRKRALSSSHHRHGATNNMGYGGVSCQPGMASAPLSERQPTGLMPVDLVNATPRAPGKGSGGGPCPEGVFDSARRTVTPHSIPDRHTMAPRINSLFGFMAYESEVFPPPQLYASGPEIDLKGLVSSSPGSLLIGNQAGGRGASGQRIRFGGSNYVVQVEQTWMK